jgi:hypothetical protein
LRLPAGTTDQGMILTVSGVPSLRRNVARGVAPSQLERRPNPHLSNAASGFSPGRRCCFFGPLDTALPCVRTSWATVVGESGLKSARTALRHAALIKVPVAQYAGSAGPTERTTVRTPTARTSRKIYGEGDQKHDHGNNNLRKRHDCSHNWRSIGATAVSLNGAQTTAAALPDAPD